MSTTQSATTNETEPWDNAAREQVFAFDVPLELSADDAARLMSETIPAGFFTSQMVPWPGAGMRVFCKRSKGTKPEVVAAIRKAKDTADTQADAAVVAMLAANPRVTVGMVRVQLGRLGFRRGSDWVTGSLMAAKAARVKA